MWAFLGEKIPGGSTLIFDVELIEIKDGPKQENIFKIIDKDEDKHLSSDEVGILWVHAQLVNCILLSTFSTCQES